MGKGRPSKEREELMYMAFLTAYEELQEGNPTYDQITERANQYDYIKHSKEGKIGDKTLLASKNKNIVSLRQRIKNDKEKTAALISEVPSALSEKIEQLNSSLGANALLASEIESLQSRLAGKDSIINDKEERIQEKNKEIVRLRDELRSLRARYGQGN